MATMPRCTMFFYENVDAGLGMAGASQSYGCTETHWYQSTTAQLTDVLQSGLDLAFQRAKLLGIGCQLTHVRVSYDDTFRDSLLRPVSQQGPLTVSQLADAQPASDMPYSDVLVRCESGSLYRKSIYLACVPDQYITKNGFNPAASWLGNWSSYKKMLKLNWGWKGKSKDPAVALSFPITIFSTVGGVTTATIPGNTFQPGQTITISKAIVQPGSSKINGQYIVQSVVGAVVTLIGGPSVNFYLGGGIASLNAYGVNPYTDLLLLRPCERKRGGLASAPRGRRKKKKS